MSKVILCGRGNTFASFAEEALHFSWQAQHFGDLHRHFAWQVQHFRCVALRVLRVALPGLREIVTTCNFCGRGRIFMR